MSCLVIGATAVGVAATTGTVMKTAASKGYKNKVKAMKKKGKFEYIAIGEVTYHYTRPLRGTSINEPIYSSIAQMKQGYEGNGNNRILVVVRNKTKGSVNFILLKRPSNNKNYFDKNNPLNGCSIDPNLKTNQGGIVESRDLKVLKKNSNTFQIEDKNYRTVQTHRKVLEIEIKNTSTESSDNGIFNGVALCELLNEMAKKGRVPKDFPSYISTTTNNSVVENNNKNKSEFPSPSTSSPSSPLSSKFIQSTANEDYVSEKSFCGAPYVDNDVKKSKKNDNIFTSTDKGRLHQCAESESVMTFLSELTDEFDDNEVIVADMAIPVE